MEHLKEGAIVTGRSNYGSSFISGRRWIQTKCFATEKTIKNQGFSHFHGNHFLLVGQVCMLQLPITTAGPKCLQSFPPALGGGLVQERRRDLVPLPQVLLHLDQADHLV